MPGITNHDSADIVVRDQNGKFEVQIPVLPAPEEDQAPPGEGEGEADGGKDSRSLVIRSHVRKDRAEECSQSLKDD